MLILDFLLLLYSDAWRSNPVTPIDPREDRKDHLFFIKKGVIEILSFIIELGGLNVPKVKLQWHLHRLLYIRLYGSDYIAVSVWGYCFIRYIGTPRPDNGVRQDTFLTPFLCPIFKVSKEDRDIFWKVKKLFLFLILAISVFTVSAQDVIVKNDGSTVLCKIIGINGSEVIYTKWSDVNGPQYIMDRSLVSNINYQDGRQEKLNEQVNNAYAPGNQQTGDANFNDNALLRMDYQRYNNEYFKKAKLLKTLGWSIGTPLIAGGVMCMVVGGMIIEGGEDGPGFSFLIPGIIVTAGGITTLAVCLAKSNKYMKEARLLSTAPVFQHEFNFGDGSSLCAGIDMLQNRRTKQTSFGFGLQYNF